MRAPVSPDERARAGVDLRSRPAAAIPLALAELHGGLPVGSEVRLRLPPGPLSACDMMYGAGFDVDGRSTGEGWLDAVRARTLPDYVGPGMRLLLVGLNPSVYAADAGVGFARPGNRFWPAMARAGLATIDRDPRHLLCTCRIGLTDLVKRPTPGVAGVVPEEFRLGLDRVERLTRWLRPGVVCFLGLTGWRHAANRSATAGWQTRSLGGRLVYVMPNPSGANAHVRLDDVAAHLLTAARGPAVTAAGAAGAAGAGRHSGHEHPSGPADAAPPHLDAPVRVDQSLEMSVREQDLAPVSRAVHVEHHDGSTIGGGSA